MKSQSGRGGGPDLTGQRYGRLTVIRLHENRIGRGGYYWECLCDCGKSKIIRATLLIQKKTKSCGCLAKETTSKRCWKHGMGNTPLAAIWRSMIGRCHNQKNKAFSHYGGRGITVCDRWRFDFLAFQEDMGTRPVGKEMDRKDNNKGYWCGKCDYCKSRKQSKNNCHWVSEKVNQRNRRNSLFLSYRGQIRHLAEWAELTGIPYSTLWARLRAGWSIKKLLSHPIRKGGQRNDLKR